MPAVSAPAGFLLSLVMLVSFLTGDERALKNLTRPCGTEDNIGTIINKLNEITQQ